MLQTTGDDESDHGRHVAGLAFKVLQIFLPEVREFLDRTYVSISPPGGTLRRGRLLLYYQVPYCKF